jgi:hypothetical protein
MVSINVISVVVFVFSLAKEHYMLISGLMILSIIENAVFVITFLSNPGLAHRDTNIHAKAYLNRVKTLD